LAVCTAAMTGKKCETRKRPLAWQRFLNADFGMLNAEWKCFPTLKVFLSADYADFRRFDKLGAWNSLFCTPNVRTFAARRFSQLSSAAEQRFCNSKWGFSYDWLPLILLVNKGFLHFWLWLWLYCFGYKNGKPYTKTIYNFRTISGHKNRSDCLPRLFTQAIAWAARPVERRSNLTWPGLFNSTK